MEIVLKTEKYMSKKPETDIVKVTRCINCRHRETKFASFTGGRAEHLVDKCDILHIEIINPYMFYCGFGEERKGKKCEK